MLLKFSQLQYKNILPNIPLNQPIQIPNNVLRIFLGPFTNPLGHHTDEGITIEIGNELTVFLGDLGPLRHFVDDSNQQFKHGIVQKTI